MAKSAKKGTYTFNELGAIIMKKYPGKFKDLKSASVQVAHVAQRLKIEDINGKKKYKQITASDADRVLEDMRESYENHPRKHATPLEKLAKKETAFIEEPKAQVNAIPSERAREIFQAKPLEIKPADERQLEADYFEVRRKRFYTDVNYFLKYAQTAGERVAIWTALSKLYGIGGTINWDLQGDAVKFNPSDGKKATESTGLDAKNILDI